ncbi:unnamed protein product [Withania somnifera]
MARDLSMILPRVLIVSRRTVRKNKFVDFVGEYHLDLIVSYGAAPVIVPRVSGVHMLLESFQPIHGVLLCEGEDIDPSLYDAELSGLSQEELEEIKKLHSSDTTIDREKDSIELALARLCLERNIPYLGICRGSQVLNVACGGTLYQDLEKELSKNCQMFSRSDSPEMLVSHRCRIKGSDIHPSSLLKCSSNIAKELSDNCQKYEKVVHMNYENYDGHRHVVKIVENTPLHKWFKDSLGDDDDDGKKMEIWVNSYHHQGVKRLAQRFVAMAFANDGLIEGFYDPDAYNPEEGKFIMGLQFHPERMREQDSGDFDYPGCAMAYREFVKAVIAYEKKLNGSGNIPRCIKFNHELESKRKSIVRSFSIAKNMYSTGRGRVSEKEPELEPGAEFLEANTALSLQQEKRLKQMGATVRNASAYMNRLKTNEERERMARAILCKMSIEQLSEIVGFYHKMGQLCSEALDKKFNEMELA